jgi:hypothetical protein
VETLQHWTETSAFFIWLRESSSIWAYPTVFFLHTIGLVFTAGASVVIDARLLGAARALPIAPFAKFFRPIWIGFWLTAASGVVMLGSDLETRVTNRIFPAKMIFVVGAVVLMLVMRRRVFDAATPDQTSVPAPGRSLALASLCCWLGAIAAGRFMAYF